MTGCGPGWAGSFPVKDGAMFTVGSPPAAETAGLPAWITPELIAETIRVWQPYHAQPLSEREAVEMLLAAANLLDCVRNRT